MLCLVVFVGASDEPMRKKSFRVDPNEALDEEIEFYFDGDDGEKEMFSYHAESDWSEYDEL